MWPCCESVPKVPKACDGQWIPDWPPVLPFFFSLSFCRQTHMWPPNTLCLKTSASLKRRRCRSPPSTSKPWLKVQAPAQCHCCLMIKKFGQCAISHLLCPLLSLFLQWRNVQDSVLLIKCLNPSGCVNRQQFLVSVCGQMSVSLRLWQQTEHFIWFYCTFHLPLPHTLMSQFSSSPTFIPPYSPQPEILRHKNLFSECLPPVAGRL